MKAVATVAVVVSAQAALAITADPVPVFGSLSIVGPPQGNPNYANSFAETSWPQNPAIRYPGVGNYVSPYDPFAFRGLPVATFSSAIVAPSFGSFMPYGGDMPYNKPWSPVAPSGEVAVFTNGATSPITPIVLNNAAPVYTNDMGSYVPYGGDIPWPYNKPWSPVAPSGEVAVFTNGATGPITPIVSNNAAPVYTNDMGPWSPVSPLGDVAVFTNGAPGPIAPIVPSPIGQVQFGQAPLYPAPARLYIPTNYPIYSPSASAASSTNVLSTPTAGQPIGSFGAAPNFGTVSGQSQASFTSFGPSPAQAISGQSQPSFGFSQAQPSFDQIRSSVAFQGSAAFGQAPLSGQGQAFSSQPQLPSQDASLPAPPMVMAPQSGR